MNLNVKGIQILKNGNKTKNKRRRKRMNKSS
jgi:hypothetical protein